MDSAKSRARDTKMPHCDDVGEAPPPLCEQFLHPEKEDAVDQMLTRYRSKLSHVEFCRMCVADLLDSTGRKWYANMLPQPSPTPSGKLSVPDVPHAPENVFYV